MSFTIDFTVPLAEASERFGKEAVTRIEQADTAVQDETEHMLHLAGQQLTPFLEFYAGQDIDIHVVIGGHARKDHNPADQGSAPEFTQVGCFVVAKS